MRGNLKDDINQDHPTFGYGISCIIIKLKLE